MKTKVKKFRFIAKIAQKIACLTACFAFSASAASVAKVGETEYDTLEAAIQAAEDGATISLAEGEYSTCGKVSNCKKRLMFVGAGAGKTIWTIGDLIKDVAGEANGDYSFDGSPEITFKEMTLKADNVNYRGFIRISKTVVEKCTLEGRTAYWGCDTASFVDSTFNAPEGDYALWDYSSKVMTFDGCQFITSGKAVNVYRDESLDEAIEVTLKDCTVNSTKDNKAVLNIKNANQAVSVTLAGENKVLIGGVETADRLYQVENAAPTATNGKSVTVVAVKADGTTEIVFEAKPPTAAVAKIGAAGYSTLAEALAAAQDGETVTLIADVTEDVTVATSVTLDLGGKTLTNAGAGKVTLTIAEGKTVTVKNGSIVGGASNYTIQNKGTATFEDVTATAGNVGSSMLDNAGTLTINSGNYSGGLNVVKSEEGSPLSRIF